MSTHNMFLLKNRKIIMRKLPLIWSDTTNSYIRQILTQITTLVCVEVLRPSQPNGVMSSAVSLPNHTITGQA